MAEVRADLKSIVAALKKDDFTEMFMLADEVRERKKGEVINIRAILEFSNYCKRQCAYCGINAKNKSVKRYRMQPKEIVKIANETAKAGYKTVVLQSGEDVYYTKEILGEIVKEIKKTGIYITLSCGERSFEDYEYLKNCGADRYLLKHETSNEELYSKLHPCGTLKNRIECLKNLKKLGYETGSGFMVGLPGQTFETIANDILLLKEIGCEMAGIGPFIPHPKTPLKSEKQGSAELTQRALALTRILLPDINLPATTALCVINPQSRQDVFDRGANVVMVKVTPEELSPFYEIYPTNIRVLDIRAGRKDIENKIRDLGKIPV